MNPDTKALAVEALTTVRDRFFRADQPERDRDLDWDIVNAALTALTQPPPVSEIRERVARIIDPVAFDLGTIWNPMQIGVAKHDALAKADSILALLPQPPGSDGEWLGIESAPKHGHFTIFDPRWGVTEGMHYDDGSWGLATFNGQVMRANPTHWRPLPAPPSPSTVADGGEEGA